MSLDTFPAALLDPPRSLRDAPWYRWLRFLSIWALCMVLCANVALVFAQPVPPLPPRMPQMPQMPQMPAAPFSEEARTASPSRATHSGLRVMHTEFVMAGEAAHQAFPHS